MNKKILITAALMTIFANLSAQSYNWVKGGGSVTSALYSRDDERVTSMCTDDNRNVYIVSPIGDFSIHLDTFYKYEAFNCCIGIPHTVVASYDCMGDLRWAKFLDASNETVSTGIVYSNGSIYTTGSLIGINKHIGYDTAFDAGNLVSYLLKLDTSGHFKWIRFTGSDSTSTFLNTGGYTNGMVNNIAVDGSGNLHHYDFIGAGVKLTSTITSTIGTYDLKYDTLGNLLSVTQMEMDSNTVMSYPVINKNSGTLYATIYVYDGSWGSVNCLAAFNSTGHIVWYDTCWWPNSYQGLSYDGNNNIYTVGVAAFDTALLPAHFTIHGDTIHGDVYPYEYLNTVLTLDTFGNLKHHYDFHAKTDGSFLDLKSVPDGKIALSGDMVYAYTYGMDSIVNTTGSQEPFIVIIDTFGSLQHWSYDTGTGFYNWGTALAVDNFGDIFIGGRNELQLSIPGLTPILSVGGNSDFFVAKYGYSCGCTMAPVASFIFSGITTVSFTYTGTVGYDSLRWDFGDGLTSNVANPIHTYLSTGAHHVCLTVYTSCGNVLSCEDIGITTKINNNYVYSKINMYPNPAEDIINIEASTIINDISIYDLLGQIIYTHLYNSNQVQVNITNLPTGLYFVKINNTVVRKFLKQ